MKYSFEWNRIGNNERQAILKYHDQLPVKLSSITTELGLKVKSATLDTGVSGEIKKDGDHYLIRVNRHDVKERQRFTVAHEVAHFLLHKDLIGDGIVDDILYRSTLTDSLEAEANRLAADILLPWTKIMECYNNMGDLKIEERIEKVASIAEVSVTAIKIRLGKV